MWKLIISLSLLSCVGARLIADGTDCVSLPKYTGGWYEIYSSQFIWNTTENGCSCSQTYYNLNATDSSSITIWNSCWRYGQQFNVTGWAKQINDTFPGQLHAELNFPGETTFPWKANYIILYIWRSAAGDYEYSLVAGSDADHWWLISRYPTVSADVWESAYQMLNAWGFNTEKPHLVDQTSETCSMLS